MIVPVSWIEEFLSADIKVAELVALLNDLGLVVESYGDPYQKLSAVLIVRVLEIAPIKGADKIRKVTIDDGRGQKEVVCGAFNFKEGDWACFAPPKTELPNGMVIEEKKLRGVTSFGMLCSPRELGIGFDASGLLILGQNPQPGLKAGMSLYEDFLKDTLLELEIPPNRPDALSVLGIARDLAAKTKTAFFKPDPRIKTEDIKAECEIFNSELCDILSARVIRNIEIKRSNPIVTKRLIQCGLRPINNVVDATNYVLVELGQPTHAYDLAKLKSPFIAVMKAKSGQLITTLDGQKREIGKSVEGISDETGDCLIVDEEKNFLGLGGIMGGENSEVGQDTVDVLVEVAHFNPQAIFRTSKRLGLRTESSIRFERGCDPEIIPLASDRVAELIKDSSLNCEIGKITQKGHSLQRSYINLRPSRIKMITGKDIDSLFVKELFSNMEFEVKENDNNLSICPPGFRPDIESEIDLIEEILRHWGYSNVESKSLDRTLYAQLNMRQKIRRDLKTVLSHSGFTECLTSVFISKKDAEIFSSITPLRISNPLNALEDCLRPTLVTNLLKAANNNLSRGLHPLFFFEAGHVFYLNSSNSIVEKESIGLLSVGHSIDLGEFVKNVAKVFDFNSLEFDLGDLTGIDDNPLFSAAKAGEAAVIISGGPIGIIGKLKPKFLEIYLPKGTDVLYCEFNPENVRKKSRNYEDKLSKFPSAEADLAFIVKDSVKAEDLRRFIEEISAPLAIKVFLFDSYRGTPLAPGERNLAYRIVLNAKDRTLTDEEINEVLSTCIKRVEERFEAKLR
jgi:phenylalanyl-tRNA synthetase beta chain